MAVLWIFHFQKEGNILWLKNNTGGTKNFIKHHKQGGSCNVMFMFVACIVGLQITRGWKNDVLGLRTCAEHLEMKC